MIADPSTLKRIREQAEADADSHIDKLHSGTSKWRNDIRRGLLLAYLRGADAGYTARCAEERKP